VTKLFVTTAVRATPALEDEARAVALELNVAYHPRRNVTVSKILQETGADRLVIVAEDRRLLRDRETGCEYAFHPNLAMLRGHNLQRGWRDLFIDAVALVEGDHILDCTLGFAGEATLASFAVGETGRVVGLESVPELAVITKYGVGHFALNPKIFRAALRRVEVVNADYRQFLPKCEPRSFDVVYFDPFFDERLPGSDNSVSPLHLFGDQTPLDVDAVLTARTVARRRVVIKTPRVIDLPSKLAELVTEEVTGRKSRVHYHIIPAEG